MEILYWFESIRTSFGDTFFSLITQLGEETVFIVTGLLFFWCINKKEGYYILFVGLVGSLINQVLKLMFRIPRPWVLDETFAIVESARAEATGYSFPSGHTQTSVGTFGSIARYNKNAAARILCISACILVPISRMYLGVHTFADVIVSFIIASILVFLMHPIVNKALNKTSSARILFAVMVFLCICALLYVYLFPFPSDTDPHNLATGMKGVNTMLGCILGLWLTYELDERFIHFDTRAVWWAQILKLAVGAVPLMLIKSGIKEPLYALFNGNYFADCVRYFIVVVFAGCIWPLTFKFFSKLGRKNIV